MNKNRIQSLQTQLTNAQKECKAAKLNMYFANCTGTALSVISIATLLNEHLDEGTICAIWACILFMYGNYNRNVYKLVQRDIKKIQHKINRTQKQK